MLSRKNTEKTEDNASQHTQQPSPRTDAGIKEPLEGGGGCVVGTRMTHRVERTNNAKHATGAASGSRGLRSAAIRAT